MSLQKIASAAAPSSGEGPTTFTKETLYQASDFLSEKWLGVLHGRLATTKTELGIDDPDSRDDSTIWYAARPSAACARCRPIFPESRSSTSGSAKAERWSWRQTFPFKRVIGVELHRGAGRLRERERPANEAPQGPRRRSPENERDAVRRAARRERDLLSSIRSPAGCWSRSSPTSTHPSPESPQAPHRVCLRRSLRADRQGQSRLALTRRLRFHPKPSNAGSTKPGSDAPISGRPYSTGVRPHPLGCTLIADSAHPVTHASSTGAPPGVKIPRPVQLIACSFPDAAISSGDDTCFPSATITTTRASRLSRSA